MAMLVITRGYIHIVYRVCFIWPWAGSIWDLSYCRGYPMNFPKNGYFHRVLDRKSWILSSSFYHQIQVIKSPEIVFPCTFSTTSSSGMMKKQSHLGRGETAKHEDPPWITYMYMYTPRQSNVAINKNPIHGGFKWKSLSNGDFFHCHV